MISNVPASQQSWSSEMVRKPFNFLCCMFLLTWWCTMFSSIPIILNLLTYRNIALIYSVTICEQKEKDCALLGSVQQKLQPHCFQLWCLPVFIISPTIYDYSHLSYLACSCSVSNMRPAHFSWWDTPESKLTSWHNSIALKDKHFQIETRLSLRHLKIHRKIRKLMKRYQHQKFLNMKEFQSAVLFHILQILNIGTK